MRPIISDRLSKYFSISFIDICNIEISDQTIKKIRELLLATNKKGKIYYNIDERYLNDIVTFYAVLKSTFIIHSNYFREPAENIAKDEINIMEFFRELSKGEFIINKFSIKCTKKGTTYDLNLKTNHWKKILFEYLNYKIEDETHEFYNIENIKEPAFHGLKSFNKMTGTQRPYLKTLYNYAEKFIEYLKKENILLTENKRLHLTGKIFKLIGISQQNDPVEIVKKLRVKFLKK